MNNLFNYINTNNNCYLCGSEMSCFLNNLKFNFNKSIILNNRKDSFYLCFPLTTKLHKNFHSNYSFIIYFYNSSFYFSIDCCKDNEIMEYIPFTILDLLKNKFFFKSIKVSKHCPECKSYYNSSSTLVFNSTNFTYEDIKLDTEYISYDEENLAIIINNYFSKKETEIIFKNEIFLKNLQPSNDSWKTIKTPLIKKTKNLKIYKNKISKYLMLI